MLAAKILACLSLGALAVWLLAIALVLNMRGYESWPTDFTVFWRAAGLALAGDATAAFDSAALGDVWQIPGGENLRADWLYPPTFLLFALPFGALPFSLALALFLVLGLGLFAAAVRGIVGRSPGMLWLVLASPAVPLALQLGNISLHLSAALAAATGALLAGRALGAGTAIAAFTVKPQLGLAFPLALAAGAAWRPFSAAAAASLALTVLATAVFGIEYWQALAAKLSEHVSLIEGWEGLIVTPYGMARSWGLAQTPALLVHAALAGGAACALVLVWRRAPNTNIALALLCLVLPFLPPRALYYECALLLVAFVHLWRAGAAKRFGGRLCLVFCWSGAPLLTQSLAGLSLTPVYALGHAAGIAWATWFALSHAATRSPEQQENLEH
ncbi:MAG: glycosyltransferase family 87 protein [Pseudomonadota bacterium]